MASTINTKPATITNADWALIQKALPLSKEQRTEAQKTAMQKYRQAGGITTAQPPSPFVPKSQTRVNKTFGVYGQQYARQHGLDPKTGLAPGLDPSKPLAGTYRGVSMPRGGKQLPAPSSLTKQQRRRLLLDDPEAFTGYGLEEGIYGKGGYKRWIKNWNKSFIDAGMAPINPEKWLKMQGYDPYLTPGQNPSEREKARWADQTAKVLKQLQKKGLGNVSMAAGSGPFDIASRNPKGQLMLINKALGKQFKTLAEANDYLAPIAGYADMMWSNLDFARRKNPTPQEQAYLATRQLGGGYSGLTASKKGDIGAVNYLMDAYYNAGPKAKKLILKQLQQVEKEMPQWLPQAYQKLKSNPVSQKFGTDRVFFDALARLTSPDARFNLTDPTKPLFRMTPTPGGASGGMMPGKFGSGVGSSFMGSVTAQQFIEDLAPIMLQSEIDPEFMDKWRAINKEQQARPTAGGRSPFEDLPEYKAWNQYEGINSGNLPYWTPFTTRRQNASPGEKNVYQTIPPTYNLLNMNPSSEFQANAALPTAQNLFMWMQMHGGQRPDFLYPSTQQNYWSDPSRVGYAPWELYQTLGPGSLERILAAVSGGMGDGGIYT